MGKYEALKRLHTIERGEGITTQSVFQSVPQMKIHGDDSEAAFIGSSQVRQFMGTRDFSTASTLSIMLGQSTHSYDDEYRQRAQDIARTEAVYAALQGHSVVDAALRAAHHARQSQQTSYHARPLRTPGERNEKIKIQRQSDFCGA